MHKGALPQAEPFPARFFSAQTGLVQEIAFSSRVAVATLHSNLPLISSTVRSPLFFLFKVRLPSHARVRILTGNIFSFIQLQP